MVTALEVKIVPSGIAVSSEVKDKALRLLKEGYRVKDVAKRFDVSAGTVLAWRLRLEKESGTEGCRQVVMTSNERRAGGQSQVWVVCPLCGCERWVQKGTAKRPGYTGRCKSCYAKVRQEEMIDV